MKTQDGTTSEMSEKVLLNLFICFLLNHFGHSFCSGGWHQVALSGAVKRRAKDFQIYLSLKRHFNGSDVLEKSVFENKDGLIYSLPRQREDRDNS